MRKKSLVAAAVAGAIAAPAFADSTVVRGPMGFDPIAASAYAELTTDPIVLHEEPWMVPQGFAQSIVSDESKLDIYAGPDWNDMNTVNETGKHAGRYMYRTHEVRPSANSPGAYTGGAVSVVDLETGEAKLVMQRQDWEALDGIVWTPWQSVLVTEETGGALLPAPEFPAAVRGLVYELKMDKKDPTTLQSVRALPMLGSMAHEGIEVDAEGNVYVVDEHATGAIYKFVPTNYGDLGSGQLYALKVDDRMSGDKTGAAEWVALDMSLAQTDARAAAAMVGATSYGRPEDLERIGNMLYVAITSEARVLSIRLGDKPWVHNFVKAGLNAPVENRGAGVTGFRSPDNLANGPDGKLWIVEDNVPSDIWAAVPDNDGDGASDGVHLFASLKDNGAEGTGLYFGKDPHALYVNVQHSSTGNDKTMVISNRNNEKDGEERGNRR